VVAAIGGDRRDAAVGEDLDRRMAACWTALLPTVTSVELIGISSRLVANSSATSARPARKPTAYGSEKA
jgi:hypothetical protein